MPRLLAFWLILLLSVCALIVACGDDDDDDNDDSNVDDDAADDDQNDDDATDDDADVDAVSSASPKDSQVLTQSHGGWSDPACFNCHQDVHRGGFALGECVACHGSNGAPRRAAGHENRDCASCHADSHKDLGFAEQHCTACHKYEAGVQCPVTENVDAVVIGAGGGGLAAADMLAQAGLKVALIEKHYKVGGYMTTFHRGDYTFEASLHAMGGLDQVPANKGTLSDFARLDITDRVQPVKCAPTIYRSIFPGIDVEIPADVNEYEQMLKDMFPQEATGITALFDELETVHTMVDAAMGISEEFNMDDLMIILGDLPGAIRTIKYLNMTLLDMVKQFVSDPELIGIWTQLVTFIGGGPDSLQAMYFLTMIYSYHFEGYYYFLGGSRSISEAMADVVREHGGDIRLNTLATKIVIEDGKAVQVQTQDDACYNTRYVVSNANAPDTLLKMVGAENLPADYVEKVENMTIGVATLQIFMGVDHDYTDILNGSHELMINETIDQDQSFEYIFEGDPYKAPIIMANYTEVDPTTAPAGKNAIVMSTYLPYDWEDTWKWNLGYEQYNDFKEEIAQIFIERMEAYLPDLSQHIEILEVGTPVTNYAFSLNPMGSILGWENTPEQATLRRLQQQTPIENLILAGAWTFPGGGQSAVMNSGISAADIIMAQEQARH